MIQEKSYIIYSRAGEDIVMQETITVMTKPQALVIVINNSLEQSRTSKTIQI